MRYHILSVLLISFAISVTHAQNASFEWVKTAGSTSKDVALSSTTDVFGNIYTTGYFNGTVDFDPGSSTYNLTSTGWKDCFIQKLDDNGNFVWAKVIGGNQDVTGYSIVADTAGGVCLTGSFYGIADFDPGSSSHNLTSKGLTDIFIQRLDSNGSLDWVHSFGSIYGEGGSSIAISSNGIIYCVGSFGDSIDFDPSPSISSAVSNGSTDFFVLKMDINGNFVWARTFGGTSGDGAGFVATDDLGNVYTIGKYYGQVDFDPGLIQNRIASEGLGDVFIQKLDANGNLVWARSFGGTSSEKDGSIAIDDSGNAYFAATYYGPAILKSNSGPSIISLNSNTAGRGVVIKFAPNGQLIWVKPFGLGGTVTNNSMAIDTSDNIFLTGYFTGTVDVDPGLDTVLLINNGSYDVYLQKLNENGDFVWAGSVGGLGSDKGQSVCVDIRNNVFVSGEFSDTVDFNPGFLTQNSTSKGKEDIFVVKLGQCSNEIIDKATVCKSFKWIDGNTYTSSNKTAVLNYTNVHGCDSVRRLDLTIFPNMTITQSGLLFTVEQKWATYRWLDCDLDYKEIINEKTDSYLAHKNGNYAVEVTYNGCIDTSDCLAVRGIGIKTVNAIDEIQIYPIPTDGNVYIELGSLNDVSLKVFGLRGELVYEARNINKPTYQFKLETAPGIYTAEIISQQQLKNFRILKK